MSTKTASEEPDLRELAIQYCAGNLWTDRECSSPEEVVATFMPLAFLDKEALTKFISDASLLYCHRVDWLPLMANGKPYCSAVHKLTREMNQQFSDYVRLIQAPTEEV